MVNRGEVGSVENLAPGPRAFSVDRICALRAERMHEVCRALGVATGCS